MQIERCNMDNSRTSAIISDNVRTTNKFFCNILALGFVAIGTLRLGLGTVRLGHGTPHGQITLGNKLTLEPILWKETRSIASRLIMRCGQPPCRGSCSRRPARKGDSFDRASRRAPPSPLLFASCVKETRMAANYAIMDRCLSRQQGENEVF